jgi:N-acetylmuramoyl-L-alanine amidase
MTRDDDNFVRLSKRTKFANDKRADIFVSVHANAAPNDRLAKIFKGIEIYYLSPAQTKRAKDAAAKENDTMFEDKDYYTTNAYLSLLSREKIIESHKLGLDVSRFMLRNLNEQYDEITNGGVKPANFWVLVGAQMPSVLVETGYITHPQEGTNLLDSHYQKLLAKGIAEGIEQYLSNER